MTMDEDMLDEEIDGEPFAGFEDEDDIDEDEEEIDEGITAKFDYDDLNIKIDSVGRAALSNEVEALRFWIVKCLLTERYKYLAYDTDFGTEFEEIIRSNPDRDIAESEVMREIEEALTVDERIESVDDFEFEWKGSHLHVSFSIESIYSEENILIEMDGDNIEQSRISFTSLS